MLWIGRRSRKQYLRLPELESAATETVGDHVVIIPARNEEKIIARAVRSLAGSRVFVVDDHSTDGTAMAAGSAGARVIPASPLAGGWRGKPNACWTGSQNTESEWIVFVDADTWYEPGFMAALLEYAARRNLAAVSVFPGQTYGGLSERILLPYAFGLYFSGVDTEALLHPGRREALANGQCLAVQREAYLLTGGHKAVAGSVIEDVALAEVFKRNGMPVRVLRAERLAHVRMYHNFRELWRGFEKNSFRFLRAHPRTAYRVVAATVINLSWLPVLALLLHERQLTAAAVLFLTPAFAWRGWYGSFRSALLAPIAIYGFQSIALSAMLKHFLGMTTDWKGRKV
jgi:chlorobactene glucosyltransferase